MRVWPGHIWKEGRCAGEPSVWLIVEERGDELHYYLSNLPESISMRSLIKMVKSRWPVEQGYQQMKEELGLDHFEGRRWAGFHHHGALVFLAFGFLEQERLRLKKRQTRREKNSVGPSHAPSRAESASVAVCPCCGEPLPPVSEGLGQDAASTTTHLAATPAK
jgi:hypothetical protein